MHNKSVVQLINSLHANKIHNFYYCPQSSSFLINQKINNAFVFPGSFNPLTHGHIAIMKAVLKKYKSTQHFVFEISIKNADKGAKAVEQQAAIIVQFVKYNLPLLITNAPLFADKLDFFENVIVLCGADTYRRIIDLKYYEMDENRLLSFLEKVKKNDSRFVVIPRYASDNGKLDNLSDILKSTNLDTKIKELLESITEELEDFRIDISSTEIRNKLKENLIEDYLKDYI